MKEILNNILNNFMQEIKSHGREIPTCGVMLVVRTSNFGIVSILGFCIKEPESAI